MNQYPYHKNLIPIPVSNRTFEYRHPHMGIDEPKKEPVMRDTMRILPRIPDRTLPKLSTCQSRKNHFPNLQIRRSQSQERRRLRFLRGETYSLE